MRRFVPQTSGWGGLRHRVQEKFRLERVMGLRRRDGCNRIVASFEVTNTTSRQLRAADIASLVKS